MKHAESSRSPDRAFDVVVIGAGVAGAAAAAALAQLAPTARIALVERASWPRFKVCGCCLNPAGVGLLADLGAIRSIRDAALPINSVELRAGTARLELDHRGGLAIGRQNMDRLLVNHAVERGVIFRPDTQASVIGRAAQGWQVLLTSGSTMQAVTPRMVLVADGLAGSALRAVPKMHAVIASNSWIGIGCILDAAPFIQHVSVGQIAMHTARGGYAGLVRLGEGKVAIAAALTPPLIKRAGTPAAAIQAILRSCGFIVELPPHAEIKGTPLLTRHRPKLATAGMLVIGDAAGYVEPFTGEGMTWALAGAQRAATLTAEVLRDSLSAEMAASAWEAWHTLHIGSRQRTCRNVRTLVHAPGLAEMVIRCGSYFAPVRSLLASKIHGLSETYPAGATP